MRRRFTLVLGITLALNLLAARRGLAEDAPEAAKPRLTRLPAISPLIHQALQSGRYEAAVELLETERRSPDAPADYLLFLLGRAYTQLEQYEKAHAAYGELEKAFPKSRWLARSRFGRADAFVRQRKYREAGLVYQAEAERLVSNDRRDQLSTILLEFADRYFVGEPAKDPSGKRKPDYKQALSYYQKILTLQPSTAVTRRVSLRVARCFQELGENDQAIAAYQQFLKRFAADGEEPAAAEEEVEARYRLGLVQLAAGQRVEARRTWRNFLRSTAAKEAGADLVPQATYRIAATYGMPSPGSVSELELGVAALQVFLAEFPDHTLADQATFEIAQGHAHHQRFGPAVRQLRRFLDEADESSKQIPRARLLLGEAYLGQKEFTKAIESWREFLEAHPAHPDWSRVQKMVIDTEFLIGDVARQERRFAEARRHWLTFLNKYPLDARAPQILFHFGQMNVLAAVEKDADLPGKDRPSDESRAMFVAAISDWQRLINKYPQTEQASHAGLMIGVIREERLGELAQALEMYRTVKGKFESQAKNRMTQLTRPQLSVMTERKFRTDETPTIRLTTRNVENVTVKVYPLDLTDYFRKMHLGTGVEALDVALIDPEKSWTYEVPQYTKYKRIDNEIEVTLPQGDDGPAPGVAAVTVSSDALEATTMLIVSDVDAVVKVSRNELFVFAENMRTQEPLAGASLLISNGSDVFAEAVTGDDGVFQSNYPELQSSKDIRVFAVHEGHCASTFNPLEGLEFAVGVSPKGYLFADRPAYRAGQLVHIKGIVRWVANDQLIFRKGEEFQLDVHDPRGRILHTQKLVLSDFGTTADRFLLPETAVAGQYRVQLHQPGRSQSYETTFQVQQYTLEPVDLTLSLDRSVFYRGEPIRGKLRLAYYYGTPLAGRTIQYRLANGPLRTAQTNDAGEVEFEFSTGQFHESQALTLSASFPERNLSAGKVVYLATRGFEIGVSTLRNVYLSGEPFDVSVKVRNPADEAVATGMRLEVLERTRIRGRFGEKSVAVHELKSDAESGLVRQTIRIEGSGPFILRATAVDQFGNSISGSHSVQISGEDDQTRLRIFADRQHYHVGDEASLQLHWREEPALALLTFEGAEILGYRLVRLKKGANRIELPMSDAFAPNFQLAATVMQPGKLHEDRSQFQVARRLNVELTPQTDRPRPGGDLEVRIKTTDDQGRPVAAELAVGLIQKSLLERFGASNAAIAEFFSGGDRKMSIRSTTSCTFQYRPSTAAISEQLIAERELVRTREMEAASRAIAVDRFSIAGADQSITNWSMPRVQTPDYPVADSVIVSGKPVTNLSAGVMLGITTKDLLTDNARYLNGEAGVAGPGPGKITSSLIRFQTMDDFVQKGELNGDFFAAVNKAGEYRFIRGTDVAKMADFSRDGIRVLPQMAVAETGFWDPAIVTDKETGEATIVITVPDRSTAWTLEARGIDGQTLAGQASSELVARKSLFAEIKSPTAVSIGDDAEFLVEVHDTGLPEGTPIKVQWKASIGEKTTTVDRELKSTGEAIHELAFPVEVVTGAGLDVEVSVTAKEAKDSIRRSIPIRSDGLRVYSVASGVSAQNSTVFVEQEGAVRPSSRTLEILVGPNLNRTLLDVVLGGPAMTSFRGRSFGSQIERAFSDVLGGIALLQLVRQSQATETPEADALTRRVKGAVGHLIASQRDDGGWSWSGPMGAKVDVLMTSRALWALSAARDAGFSVPAEVLAQAIANVKTAATKLNQTDREKQAVLLHGLAVAGAGEFALANRLYRDRNRLTASGLLHVALSLHKLRRTAMAVDLLKLVQWDKLDAAADGGAALSWMRSRVELQAVGMWAYQQIAPDDPRANALSRALLASRGGSRWAPEKANGPAVAGLSAWYARSAHQNEKYRLGVFVNDRLVERIDVDPKVDGSRRLLVPAETLVDGESQRVSFEIEGRANFSYSIVLSGTVPADQARDTTRLWQVERRYTPAPRLLDGEAIPRGFGILIPGQATFENPLTQMPIGARGDVMLRVRRFEKRGASRDYLVVTEPLPAGAVVLRDSVRGGFEHFEVRPGEIVFYVGNQASPKPIRYSIAGYLPGTFGIAPAVARSFYAPSQIAVSKPHKLDVLARGGVSKDEYRLTPVERLEFGKRLVAKKRLREAHEHLVRLYRDYRLRDEVYAETVRLLFQTVVDTEMHDEIVEYFEIIKEKLPQVEIGFSSILKVAAAYRELGEYERSYLVFRATVQARFEREIQVAGFLDERGEFLRSIHVMESLLQEYPSESYIAAATYALAQETYGKAADAANDPQLRKVGLTRIDLIAASIHLLDHFLSTWPSDPAADQASFSLVNSLLDLERFERAIVRCESYVDRFPKSKLLDSFWYMIGYSQFALGRHDAALEVCQRVAEMTYHDDQTGVAVDAANKWQAVYIMGQVHHSLGDAAQAIREYKRVAERFPDASEAIRFFERRSIGLPEIAVVKPGEPTRLKINFRNIAKANLKVYRIDLLKFGLLQRNLNRITAINLAGIRPYHELDLELGDGFDYRDREREVPLPLDDVGAYLVVARGSNEHASSLVLVSPLTLAVQEDTRSGRVRVTVRDVVADRYVRDVDVKVIGSANSEFTSGETDLRGVFVADAIVGTSTVIARFGQDAYAFFRGQQTLGSPPAAAQQSAQEELEPAQMDADGDGAQNGKLLLKGLQRQNLEFNGSQRNLYRSIINNNVEGVKADGAF